MDDSGKFNHIEDILANLHLGQWFGWSDPRNKIYENLIIHDKTKDKPTKKSLEDELKKKQDEFDSAQYKRDRALAYPPLAEQMDLLYHGGIDALKAELKKTKDKYPKT